MIWIVVAALVCAAGVIFFAQRRRMEREVEQIQIEAREFNADVEREAHAASKRLKREHQRALSRAEHDLLQDLLPLIDALDAAVEVSKGNDVGTLEGLELVRRQLESVLESHDVTRICPEPNQKFDPTMHEGVEMIEVEGVKEGRIARCRRVGFKQGDDVLRAAVVAVGSGVEASNGPASSRGALPDADSAEAVEVEQATVTAES